MNTAAALADALCKAFDPPPSGFVGIVDNLLQLCSGGEMELAWRSNACHARIRQGTVEQTVDLPLRKGVFRAILARVAALCNQRQPGFVSPYGGRGEIHLGPGLQAVYSANFVNTAAEQSLKLSHLSYNGMAEQMRRDEPERNFFSVFVHGRNATAVVAWLENMVGPLTALAADDWPKLYESPRGQVLLGVIPEEDEVSIWFQRDGSWSDLWSNLAECAEQASQGLDAEVVYFVGDEPMSVFRGRRTPAEL